MWFSLGQAGVSASDELILGSVGIVVGLIMFRLARTKVGITIFGGRKPRAIHRVTVPWLRWQPLLAVVMGGGFLIAGLIKIMG